MTNAAGAAPGRKGGCAKALGIGCLVVVLALALGGFLAYRSAKGLLGRVVAEYTEAAPRALPVLSVSDDEAAAVLQRVSEFAGALKESRATGPLVLSGRDVNVLIQRHPGWTNLAGKVYVSIEGDRIGGQASIPLGDLGRPLAGRFLNGSVTLQLGLAVGRLLVFIDTVEVKGRPLPDAVMKGLRAKNLAENTQADAETTATLGRLESIVVRDGCVRLDPKPVP